MADRVPATSSRQPPSDGMSSFRLHRTLLGLLVAALFGAFLLWRTDLTGTLSSLRDLDPFFLLAAAALRLTGLGLLSLRWHTLIRHLGSPGAAKLVPALAIGHMGNTALPFRLGTVLQAQYMWSRYGIAATSTLGSVALGALLDAVVIAGLFIPVLLVLGVGGSLPWTLLVVGVLGAALLVLTRFLLSGRLPGSSGAAAPRHLGVLEPLAARLASWQETVSAGLRSIRSTRTIATAVLLTVAARLVTVGVHWLVGLAIGLDIDWTSYIVVTAAVNVSGFLALTQGNIGPYEVIAAEVVAGLGAGRASATAYAIAAHAVLLVPVAILGLLFLTWHSTAGPGMKRPLADES